MLIGFTMKGMLLSITLMVCTMTSMTASVLILRVNRTTTTPDDMPFYCQYCLCVVDDDGGIRSDCYSKGLFKLPRSLSVNTTELYMRKNLIPTVKYEYLANMTKLRILDLSSNVISGIDVDAFKDLVSLEELYLHENKFRAYDKSLPPGVFSGLKKLKTLTLYGCISWQTALHTKLPKVPFLDLTGLEELSIDGVKNVRFGEEFSVLKHLKTIKMSGVRGQCAIRKLSKFSFEGISGLTSLVLEKCSIDSIETDTFYNLYNLEFLDLSFNVDLGFTGLGKIYLQSTNLKTLKINSIHAPYRAGSEILRENMRNIRDTKLVTIYMNSNGLEYIDYGVFDMLPKTVKYLSMRDNRLNFGLYVYEAVFNTALEVFEAGSQHPVIPADRAYTDVYYNFINEGKRRRRNSEFLKKIGFATNRLETHEYKLDLDTNALTKAKAFPMAMHRFYRRKLTNDQLSRYQKQNANVETPISFDPRMRKDRTDVRLKRGAHEKGFTTITKLVCSGSRTGLMLIDFNNTDNNITYMDVSMNFIKFIKAESFLGLDKLLLLNLSGNYIEHIDVKGFMGLHSLKTLDLHNNLLGFRLGLDANGVLFSQIPNAVHLNLSMNRISNMDKKVFTRIPKVETIDLSMNHLHDFKIDVENLNNLKFLNLSNNRIKQLDEDTRDAIDKLGDENGIAIDFSSNNFLCNCETLEFLHWINSAPIDFINREQYFCTFNNGTIKTFNSSQRLLDLLDEECTSYIGIIVSCTIVGSFVASLASFFVLYRQRWRLLYLFYMAKAKLYVGNDMGEKDIRFQHDIFISYGDGDRMFVIKEMIDRLENIAGLKLNIRDRDFDVGEMVAVNISRAVRNSKRTFLLLSRHFLKNKWCNFEMNMARMEGLHMKRKVIVLVFLEPIPNNMMPLEILDLLRDCPNIEYPNNNLERHAFWEKCKELVHV